MRSKQVKVFYNPRQVLQSDTVANFSKSPLKPKLLLEHLTANGLIKHFKLVGNFRPYNAYDFQIAHTVNYVSSFFECDTLASSNGLKWTPQFADSVRYTNASLWEAVKNSLVNPSEVSFSPTSGFHHASPNRGAGFCTFSGQVIASVKAYRKFGAVGCYIDLDGHFGNSIEDTRKFQPDLNFAVPVGFNFNSRLEGEAYYRELVAFIVNKLTPAVVNGKIDYVVWCHGADSHEWDQLGHQVNTDQWVRCARFFWTWVKRMDDTLGRPLSVVCALFGGYRADDYDSVLSLHASDLRECMNCLLGLGVEYETNVKPVSFEEFGSRHEDSYKRKSKRQTTDSSRYTPSLDRGSRMSDEELLKIKRREWEKERDRRNEEEFEKFYALRQRLNGNKSE